MLKFFIGAIILALLPTVAMALAFSYPVHKGLVIQVFKDTILVTEYGKKRKIDKKMLERSDGLKRGDAVAFYDLSEKPNKEPLDISTWNLEEKKMGKANSPAKIK